MADEVVEQLKIKINAAIEAIKTQINSINLAEWKGIDNIVNNTRIIRLVILKVVAEVEVAAKEIQGVTGEQKLEAVTEILDDLVKLNVFLEMFDGIIIKMMITWMVDQLNAKFGNDWGSKLITLVEKIDYVNDKVDELIKKL